MLSIRPFVRPIAFAVALALCAAPAAAHAEGKERKAETKKERKFPMPAESFNQMVERRIREAREQLFLAIDANPMVPDATKAQIKKDFDDGSAAVKALAEEVAADGTVTKEEADKVRDLAKDLAEKAREKYLPGSAKQPPKEKKEEKPRPRGASVGRKAA
jgi:hypothetical protein